MLIGVYPRVCGGASAPVYRSATGSGLSPRVRGSPWWDEMGENVEGSIPACAGEPGAIWGLIQAMGVYPRVCGGAETERVWQLVERGLSPRVRGSHLGIRATLVRLGSIPACAGEPCPSRSLRASRTVYPRVCGGAGLPVAVTVGAVGLSPRVRGSQLRMEVAHVKRRSIPACAGEPS